MFTRPCLVIAAALGVLPSAAPSIAQAQPSATAPSWTSRGYNGAAAGVASPFNPATRDAGGNRVVINGEIQSAGANSVQDQFATLAGGALNTATGAGPNSSATAIGNQLSVQVTGSWNTVIVSANQTNNATVTAQAGAGSAVSTKQKASGNGQ